MIKQEELPVEMTLAIMQRQQLYLKALCSCPNYCHQATDEYDRLSIDQFVKAGGVVVSKTFRNERELLTEAQVDYPYWEQKFRTYPIVEIGDVVVDCKISERFFVCKCTKCGETWKVSKRALRKKAKRLDRAIAMAENKLPKRTEYYKEEKIHVPLLLSFIALGFSVVALIYNIIRLLLG